ncbi:MAG TPA: APC family permease, partial [Candidatus Polarisedimenticolia bacterium]|nr:APC family permease [Candidatus Polarisedimenticolia bacterium]
ALRPEGRVLETEQAPTPGLRRALGLGDVVLYFITAGVNLQWVAIAAVAGPSALLVWLLAFLVMSLPLAFCVVELSSRYPQEGGMYVWSKRAFGDFAAFMTGWTYWMSNLPYFPGVLYFAAGNALYVFGGSLGRLATSPAYFILASIVGLFLGTGLNVVGLGVGKWLTNLGAVARWLATLALMGVGAVAWLRFGSATEFNRAALIPGLGFKDLVFWATIAFALTGFESGSFMGEEIRDARRTIPRAIFTSAPLIVLAYVLGTAAVLVALPAREVSGLQGVIDAFASADRRLGWNALTPVASALITLSALGSVGAWLGSTARLPFVAGIDNFLPRSFARVHPRWRTPHVSLWAQAAVILVCILLSQAGTTVKGAYDILVSMTVISLLLPFLLLFAAAIRVQREPAGPEVIRVPGGRPAAIVVASVGLLTTAVAIVLSVFPPADTPRPGTAIAKVVGLTILNVGAGVVIYGVGRRRRSAGRTSS